MLSNSDIHSPLNLDYDLHTGDHRPLTLVFARERSPEAIKEALFDRRTAVYSGTLLIGREEFLRPIFERSVRVITPQVQVRGTGRTYVQLHNESDLPYTLQPLGGDADLSFPRELRLPAGRTALLEVKGRAEDRQGERTVRLTCTVTNLLVRPREPLSAVLEFKVTLLPK
jgi:hypothetical protein